MAILLKTASIRVSSIQIMQVRVQNKGKSVWKSRYVGDVSIINPQFIGSRQTHRKTILHWIELQEHRGEHCIEDQREREEAI